MAQPTNGNEKESTRDDFSIVESVRAVAAYNARADLSDEHQLLLFLQSWWSKTYNRPLKDPLLQTYTLAELIYEFYDRVERQKAEEERISSENDKIEESKEKEALDWAEQEEKKDLEAMKDEAGNASNSVPAKDPTKDADNIAWMEEQIRKAKEEFGDSFGEDIDENFE